MSATRGSVPADAPAEIFGEIRRATEDLRRAATQGDAVAIREAVDRRQAWVDRLESRVVEIRKAGCGDAEAALNLEALRLAEQAKEAERGLLGLLERARRERELHQEQASAVRTYAAAPAETNGLDREG